MVPYGTGTLSVSSNVLNGARGIAAGSWHLLVLASDGTVTGFGLNPEGQATGVPLSSEYPAIGQVSIRGELLTNVVAVAAGLNHSLALTSVGTVVGWGNNQRGQSSIPPGLTNVTAIAAGGYSSIALKRDGTVVTWGLASGGPLQPDDLTNVIGVAATAVAKMYPRFLVLRKNGKVAAWGGGITEAEHDLVTPPPGLSDVVSIALGSSHSLALLRNGTIVGWGGNSSGEATGSPNLVDPYISNGVVTLNGEVLTNVIAIAAGHEHSLAVTRDGKVHAWGSNRGRECLVPPDLRGAKAVAAGQGWSAAITSVPVENGE
jgi:alpha-tubulin suppressor-like RCC1 family protein